MDGTDGRCVDSKRARTAAARREVLNSVVVRVAHVQRPR